MRLNHLKINHLIILGLFCSLVLVGIDIQTVYAQVSVTLVTTNIPATDDCSFVSAVAGIIFLGCSDITYVIDEDIDPDNVIVSTSTPYTNPKALAGVSTFTAPTIDGEGANIFLLERGVSQVQKWTYRVVSGNPELVQTGVWEPTCSFSTTMIYDELGFMWFTCPTQEKIMRLNPSTMTTAFDGNDMTDGAGIECDDPDYMSYSTADAIGVIHCSTSNNYVTFSCGSCSGTGTTTLLDSEADGSTETAMLIHEKYNRIFVPRNGGVFVYSYTSITGIMTLEQSGLGDTSGYDGGCRAEPYITTDVFYMCYRDAGTNQKYDAFQSGSAGVAQIMSQLVPINTVVSHNVGDGIGFDIQRQVWYGVGSTNENRYVRIEGLRDEGTEPEPPTGGTGSNNQVGGVCGNTDTNGDGRVNVIDCVGNTSAWTGFTSGVPAVQVVGSVTDGLGLTDCASDGSDQDTCGSGLFMFILVLLIVEFLVLAGYLGLTSKLNADRETIDVLLIMLIAGFAVLAIAFYLDWIPDLVFYSIVAMIAGFLTFGLIAKIRGK
jgi:hypothetical protein